MTTETIEACTICEGPGPLERDPAGGGLLCTRCQHLVNMGPEWINNAIQYLNKPPVVMTRDMKQRYLEQTIAEESGDY